MRVDLLSALAARRITIEHAGHRLRKWDSQRWAYEREMFDWLRQRGFAEK
jgi:hypothetical protein